MSIAILGGANIDINCQAADALRLGDSVPGVVWRTPGGVARNIAENLARLGESVSLHSFLGKDDHGQGIFDFCLQLGIDVRCLKRSTTCATSAYVALHNGDGEMQYGVSDMAILGELDQEELSDQWPILSRADAWVVDTNLPEPSLAYLLLRKQQREVFMDGVSAAKVKRLCGVLAAVDHLKVNAREAGILCGLDIDGESAARRAAGYLLEQGIGHVYISLAGNGLVYGDGGDPVVYKPPRRAVVNDTGAGDALMAGLVYAWKHAWDKVAGIRFAIACAALTCEHRGACNPKMKLHRVLSLMQDDE